MGGDSNVVRLEKQREQKLRICNPGMSGGRECPVCKPGGGYHLKRNKPAAKQVWWRCIDCERYVCDVCYLLGKNHIGFRQVNSE